MLSCCILLVIVGLSLDGLSNHSHTRQHLYITASISLLLNESLHVFFSVSKKTRRHVKIRLQINSIKADIIQCTMHISYIRLPIYTANIHTHVEWAWSVDAWPTDQLVSQASHTMCDASPSTLTSTQWQLDSQNFWTCRTCMNGGRHFYQPQSHWHRASDVHEKSQKFFLP